MADKLVENYLAYINEADVPIPYIMGLAMISYNRYKDNVANSRRACDNYTSDAKSKCLVSFKLSETNRLMAELDAIRGRCRATKNPEKCSERMNKKIDSVALKIDKLEDQAQMINRRIMAKARMKK